MIQLYNPDNTNYENNGDIILLPVKCEETAGINRTWQIDIEHPIDEEGRWKYIVIDAVIKCPSINGMQLWRVVQTEKRDSGVIATCDPIFYDAAKETIITSRITLNDKTCQEALDILCEGTGFSGTSTIEGVKSTWYEWENLVEVMTGNEHGLVKTYDGEIAFDNYTVHIESELGGDYGVSVMYGKNLPVDGISESVNIDGTFTRIIPVAYNGYTLPELYVDSEFIDDYPTPRIGIIHYDNLRLWSDREEGEQGDSTTEYYNSKEELYEAMREAAAKEYTENEIDRPSVSLEVEMVLLQNTEEYKDYQELESVNIGDYVRCYNPRLGIDTKTRVRSITYDCIRERVTFVELGKEKRNYFDNVTSLIERIEGAITPGGGIIAEKVQGFLNGAWTQLRVQNTIAQHQDVRAILFEDLDPESPTFGALSIGTQGWEISRQRTLDGRDWIWTTAATAGGIIANTIVTGLLSDKLGRNYWNLDTGDFRLQGATIVNSNVDGYATEDDFTTFATAVNSALDDLQDQIDGIVDTWFYSGEPAMNKPPVTYDGTDPDTGWDTDAKKRAHIGDIYYDTDTDYAYRFIFENNTYGWMRIADSDVTEALRLAQQAQDTADNKRRVFVTTPFVPYDVGDIWMQGTSGDILVCTTAKNATQSYSASDFQKRNKYIDTATVNNSINTYDAGWTQTKTFNRLTNNGLLQGIYMENGELYINGSYLKTGVLDGDLIKAGRIQDQAGINYWDMTTGEFRLTGGTIGENVTLQPLENIEFGGTNLLSRGLTVNNPTAYNFYRIPMFEKLEAEQEYTLQFWGVELDPGSTGIGVYWGGGSNKLINESLFPDENGYIKRTITVTDAQASHAQAANLWLNLYNYVNGHAGANACYLV